MNYLENIGNDFSKKNIMLIADRMHKDVVDGNAESLPLYIKAKFLESLSKEIIKKCKDIARDEASNYSKSDSTYNNAEFSLSNSGDTLNYSDDFDFADLKRQLDSRKDKLKKAFDMSKDGAKYIDEHGEVIPVVSIKKHSETIIKVSFK